MTTPPLSEASGTEHTEILIKDVVQRLKCELSEVFDNKMEQPDFLWLTTWTAHADLSLEVNNAAGLSPNGSFTKFHQSGRNFDAGPTGGTVQNPTFGLVPQFFSISIGANLSGQATRTETVSFTVALDELKMWRQALDKKEANLPPEKRTCNFPPSTALTGNLGLQEWVNSAFFPVEMGQLQAGIHAAPSGGKAGATKGPSKGGGGGTGRSLAPERALGDDEIIAEVKKWQEEIKALQTATKEATTSISSSSQKINQSSSTFKTKLSDAKVYRNVMVPYLRARYERVQANIGQYLKNAETCSAYKSDIDAALALSYVIYPSGAKAGAPAKAIGPTERMAYQQLLELMAKFDANSYEKGAADCAAKLQKQADESAMLPDILPTQPDPPIDSVLHSLQFVVSYGANVTPSWTLVQWKGPGQSGNFASASGIRTHSLQLALGPRSGAPAISSDATRLIQNQTVKSLGN